MEPGTEIATRDEYLAVVDEDQELHVGAVMPTPGDGRVGGDAGLAGTGEVAGDGNPGRPEVAEAGGAAGDGGYVRVPISAVSSGAGESFRAERLDAGGWLVKGGLPAGTLINGARASDVLAGGAAG